MLASHVEYYPEHSGAGEPDELTHGDSGDPESPGPSRLGVRGPPVLPLPHG